MKHLRPTYQKERVLSIDILRGVALLGILLINIVGMGLPDPAYFDPSIVGGHDGWNYKIFFINSLLFEGAMRGLFSLLFGAGIALFAYAREEEAKQIKLWEVWFRRLGWLIPLGMVHAYILLWPGDILFAYGFIGLLLFPFRRLSPSKLIVISALIVVLGILLNIQDARQAKQEQKEYFTAVSMLKKGQELPYDTMISYYGWMERYATMKPRVNIIESRIDNYHQGYKKAFQENVPYAKYFESEYHYRHNYIDILSMMLLGIALFKMRVLHAEKSKRYYLLMMFCGYGIGLIVNYLEIKSYVDSYYDLIKYYDLLATYDIGRIFTMFGHIALIMLFCKMPLFLSLKRAFAAVGKMALTNYLMHSFIALVVFVGFKQYGLWERYQLYYLVVAIWVFQLVISSLWLRYFRFGPIEWIWRYLSYRHRPRFRKL